MASHRFCAVLALICMCVSAIELSASAAELGSSRRLLQTTGCSADYATMDYSPITSACKSPYPLDTCCNAYNSFCAPYKSELNDLSRMCAMYFNAYLNMAGSYENGVFMGRCNKGTSVCN